MIFSEMTLIGVILCEKSIPRIPEAWKRFLDPDSGNGVGVLKRKSNIFGFLWENRRFLGFSRQGIDCAYSRIVYTFSWPWFRGGVGVLKRKSIYLRKESYINVVRVDFYYKQCVCACFICCWERIFWFFPESGSRKRFHGSGVRAIDSPSRKT